MQLPIQPSNNFQSSLYQKQRLVFPHNQPVGRGKNYSVSTRVCYHASVLEADLHLPFPSPPSMFSLNLCIHLGFVCVLVLKSFYVHLVSSFKMGLIWIFFVLFNVQTRLSTRIFASKFLPFPVVMIVFQLFSSRERQMHEWTKFQCVEFFKN